MSVQVIKDLAGLDRVVAGKAGTKKENRKRMFDRLEDLLIRFEEIMSELNEPFVVNDQTRFQKLMKEQSDLAPIVENSIRNIKSASRISRIHWRILDEESDEEMRELAKEELKDSKEQVEELEKKLKILLLPKGP